MPRKIVQYEWISRDFNVIPHESLNPINTESDVIHLIAS